jgi:HD-GYP domain-containing protein (c-di-GMP phosphodiesterase class II)
MAQNFLYLLRKKDIKTYQHSMAIERYAMLFSKYLQLPQEEQIIARYAGALHDIGKLFVPDSILKKPSSLTDEEFEVIKEHPVSGYQIFRQYWCNQDNKYIKLIGETILHHHERFDGSGYPDGISIGSLSIITSIVSICDVYGALLSDRYYKPAYSPEEALEILDREKEKQFQPELLEEFFTFAQKKKFPYTKNNCYINKKKEWIHSILSLRFSL